MRKCEVQILCVFVLLTNREVLKKAERKTKLLEICEITNYNLKISRQNKYFLLQENNMTNCSLLPP